jgi:uncharacterized protein
MSEAALVVMAKQPQPERTKTRLCPPFTPLEAAQFYEALLKDTLSLAASIDELHLAVAITPPESHAYFQSIAPAGTLLLPVTGVDIGECLIRALSALLERGYNRALALNADGPSLPPGYLRQAVKALEENDLVLGPGEDGGYYLVGLKKMQVDLFQNITWSTSQVLKQTLLRAESLKLDVAMNLPWYDVDLPADVDRLRQELQHLPPERLVYSRRFFERQIPEPAPE